MAQLKIIARAMTLLLLYCNTIIVISTADIGQTYTSLSCSRRSNRDHCSWDICINESCKCGRIANDLMDCTSDGHVSVLDCNCITYDEHSKVEVGKCIYNCMNHKEELIDTVYHEVPNNVSGLNELVCSKFNRQGTLCGECKNGTFPLVYSFNLTCVSCPETTMNWVKYFSVAFIPLTVFYFSIVLFKINIASSHLYGFAFYSQVTTMPVMSRVIIIAAKGKARHMVLSAQVVSALYGIWNLDFFRLFELGICLRLNTLTTLSLDIAVAVYPILLMALSYILINLHDKNYRVLVIAWRPFRAFFSLFHRHWDIRTSLVDSFATFLVLSHVKIISAAYDLLTPVQVYNISSSGQVTRKLYYDATVVYLGKEHIPYAVLAIVTLAVFVIIPALIFIAYPFRGFQKLLNALPARWHIFHIFMDSFQGCYKDGSEPGTRDHRWFASVFILFRLAMFVVTVFTANSIYFVFGSIALALLSISLLILQPYKAKFHHYLPIITIFLLLLGLYYVAISGIDLASIELHKMTSFYLAVVLLVWCLPLLYISFLTLQWILARRKFGAELVRRWQARKNGYKQLF